MGKKLPAQFSQLWLDIFMAAAVSKVFSPATNHAFFLFLMGSTLEMLSLRTNRRVSIPVSSCSLFLDILVATSNVQTL